ncbi:hypothetical protein [Paenibacillus hexagrammi]|uniref:D-alanyl-lipoteichoic acid biosynthesis protein DltD n=1 Tax=Paenibacillus hexagrammi TaxID=2908839 RepID=A0ABY3SGQ1_9BACL|nr:hypothetical protein [Paenibacillus sp. YPD9-1]UJF33164.1 hypothetical protein L0M14_27095 [Paenibacillus sp. YPD9-1]
MKFAAFLKKNGFVLGLLLALIVSDLLISWWNPMVSSRRFYKNDFTKTLFHHNWSQSGPVFFGNSSVTAAYIEEQSDSHLIEMGLSYGKITDLKEILDRGLYHVQDELVVGIDVHTMLDSLETDPTYPWFKPWYQPYVYTYRDYFRDSGTEFACALYEGLSKQDASRMEACAKFPETLKLSKSDPFAYQPRWIDKELYHNRIDDAALKEKWADYDKRFGWMTLKDFQDNLDALQWVLEYAKAHNLTLRVIWMPWNKGYEQPPYVASLKQTVNAQLEQAHVPVLDLLDHYEPQYFHDLVHLNREDGAPLFTKEVDAWLHSLEKPSKS